MTFGLIVLAAALPVFDFVTNSIAQRIAGADPAVALSRFVDYPSGASKDKFVPNAKFWLKGVDFSCASPWNSGGGQMRAGTLISKRHVIFAKHFPLWKDVRIVFVGDDGGVCPCYIEKTKGIDGCDIAIGLLDYEVTPNIHPAKILPDDFVQYIGHGTGLPFVTFNQREQVFLAELRLMKTDVLFNAAATNSAWRAFGGKIVSGDSGNPAFLLIGNEPILLYCLLRPGVGHGPIVYEHRKEIQKAMDELCPGYKLEVFDFSKSFPAKRIK